MSLPGLAESYELLTNGVAAVRLPRDVVRISGPDAATWLQGQVSQDVLGLAEGGSAWSFILQPQGKVDAWFRVTREADDVFVLDVDAGHGEALVARLNRFKLRVKAEVELIDGEMVAVISNGNDYNSPIVGAAPFFAVGLDMVGQSVPMPDGVTEVSAEAYEVARIEAGMPKMGSELTEDTIPNAAGVVERSASFTKGCYTGQELVARVDSRGNNTPTQLRLVRSPGEMAAGDVVGDDQGTITSAAVHPHGGSVALAYIKRAVEVPCALSINGVDAEINPVPSAATTAP